MIAIVWRMMSHAVVAVIIRLACMAIAIVVDLVSVAAAVTHGTCTATNAFISSAAVVAKQVQQIRT
jgi:hypothetical protein